MRYFVLCQRKKRYFRIFYKKFLDMLGMGTSSYDMVERIDKILREKNLNRTAACKQVGISIHAMTDWSKKGSIPAADTLVGIAQFLGTTAEYLITGESSTVPKEMESFFSKYTKFSVLLEDLSVLTIDQVDTVGAMISVLVEKNNAKEGKMA